MKYALLILFSLVLGIAHSQSDSTKVEAKSWYYQYKNGPKVDTILKPYVDDFLAECKKYGVSTKKFYKLNSVTFSSLPGSIVGYCFSKQNKVYIDITKSDDAEGLTLLVFHELGHCVLGLAHISNESGLAIMNPVLDFDDLDKYYDNWDALLIMLFSDKHPNLKEASNCCPDMIEDPCTYNGVKN